MEAVQAVLHKLLQQAASTQWRGLVVLHDKTGRQDTEVIFGSDALCMGGNYLVPLTAYRAHLGRAYSAVVLDFRQQQHADALAAMAGTVIAGGILVIIVSRDLSPFMQHLLAQLPAKLYQQAELHNETPLELSSLPLPARQPVAHRVVTETMLSDEQRAVASALLAHQHNNPAQPALITASRGRGKSTVLGFLAHTLAQQGATIYLCAPSKAQADTLLRQAFWRAPAGQQRIHFVAPDALLSADSATLPGVLILDEAASLPRHMLDTLLRRYPGVIMATTTQGYECCGRGFLLQFQQRLKSEFTHALQVTLSTPYRFAAGCPLEQWLEKRLFLANASAVEQLALTAPEPLHYSHQSAGALADEHLEQCFNLLMEAHYQTRPNDLKLLLDDPTQSLMLQWSGRRIVSVAWLAREGELPSPLAKEVVAGRRRPPGNLLAQGLARHLREPTIACLRMLRIVRIAVQPHLQGQGLGSQLLAEVKNFALSCQVQLLGTSFGASVELVHFWARNGYAPVKLGAKADTVTARFACLCIQPLSAEVDTQAYWWQQFFKLELTGYCDAEGTHPALLHALASAVQPAQADPDALNQAYLDFLRQRLVDVANGELEFHAVQVALRRFPAWQADEPLLKLALSEPQGSSSMLQQYGLRGRKDLLKALREVCFRLSVKI